MYISGNQYDLERRMKFCVNFDELTQYKNEVVGFVNDFSFFLKYKIEKEYQKRAAMFGEFDYYAFMVTDDGGFMLFNNGDNIKVDLYGVNAKTFDSTKLKFDSNIETFDNS